MRASLWLTIKIILTVFGGLLGLAVLDGIWSLFHQSLDAPGEQYSSAYSGYQNPTPLFLICLNAVRAVVGWVGHENSTDWIIAFATTFIAAFTITLWWSAYRQSQHFMVSERAYVRLSHSSVPGLTIDPSGNAKLTIRAINSGKTPATISAIVVTTCPGIRNPGSIVYKLPDMPNYWNRSSEERETFLVAGDEAPYDVTFQVRQPDLNSLTCGYDTNVKLCVYGYVDYTDVFGVRHVAGYARWFDPNREGASGNNLIPVSQPNWNYDRVARPGWDGKHPPPKER